MSTNGGLRMQNLTTFGGEQTGQMESGVFYSGMMPNDGTADGSLASPIAMVAPAAMLDSNDMHLAHVEEPNTFAQTMTKGHQSDKAGSRLTSRSRSRGPRARDRGQTTARSFKSVKAKRTRRLLAADLSPESSLERRRGDKKRRRHSRKSASRRRLCQSHGPTSSKKHPLKKQRMSY